MHFSADQHLPVFQVDVDQEAQTPQQESEATTPVLLRADKHVPVFPNFHQTEDRTIHQEFKSDDHLLIP